MKWLWFYGSIALFVAGFACAVWYRAYKVKVIHNETHFTPSSLPISSAPPTEAEGGVISKILGAVQIDRRGEDSPVPLTADGPILQGESLAVLGVGSVRISFTNGVSADLGAYGEVALVDTIPTEFLLAESGGTVGYTVGNVPLSVRVGITLVQSQNAQYTVSYTPKTKVMILLVKRGVVTVGYEDTGNTTHTLEVHEGQSFTVYGTSRSSRLWGK